MRGVKKDVLKLIKTFIEKSDTTNIEVGTMITQNFIPNLIDLLENYLGSRDDTKEAEVISLFSTIIQKLNAYIPDFIPKILSVILQSSLSMITKDFNSFPDHRVNFFEFLKTVINNAFVCIHILKHHLTFSKLYSISLQNNSKPSLIALFGPLNTNYQLFLKWDWTP